MIKNMIQPDSPQSSKEKAQHEMTRKFGAFYDAMKRGERTIDALKNQISPLFLNERIQEAIPDFSPDSILEEIDTCGTAESKDNFISCIQTALLPVLHFKEEHPREFEDIQALVSMDAGGFTPLNERLSYGAHNGNAHFHLAASFEIPDDEKQKMFLDGMQKLAKIVENDESIEDISGTSWIVATKKYGSMLASYGFDITEVPEGIREKYFAGETREMKKAIMERTKFLKTFGEHKQ
jgi:hypothetical protein